MNNILSVAGKILQMPEYDHGVVCAFLLKYLDFLHFSLQQNIFIRSCEEYRRKLCIGLEMVNFKQ